MIMNCVCEHEYQDSKYGRGKRVFNEDTKGNAKCTVCGQIRAAKKSAEPAKKGKSK